MPVLFFFLVNDEELNNEATVETAENENGRNVSESSGTEQATSEKVMMDTTSSRTKDTKEESDCSNKSSRSASPLRADDADVHDNELNEKQQVKQQQLHKFMKTRQLLCLIIGVLVRLAIAYIALLQVRLVSILRLREGVLCKIVLELYF